jgi:hypothetical protein
MPAPAGEHTGIDRSTQRKLTDRLTGINRSNGRAAA